MPSNEEQNSNLVWIESIRTLGILKNMGAHASEISYYRLDGQQQNPVEFTDVFENEDWTFVVEGE